VDFDAKRVRGWASHTVALRRGDVREVVLDTNALVVSGVEVDGQPASYSLEEPHPVLGRALRVTVPAGAGPRDVRVRVAFETTRESSAIQFLRAAQTHDGKHPFLFTQSQAIHARSFFPCQDAPAVKVTWDATVRVPSPLTALMSAESVSWREDGDARAYEFHQPVPTSSYLVALVVGHVQSRDLGPRTRVWAEPSVVAKAEYEFAEIELFLGAAEALCGPYVWGRFDFIVLPPSFPYGGMEDPRLTLLTPTLLAGDRSLVNVIIHELAHSWSGNLVTNATWEDFWLNEGWTVFLERRIIRKLYGSAREGLKAIIGRRHLEDDVRRYGEDHRFTALHVPNAGDTDPDDAFSSVPYEKGADFLEHLERVVGGPQVFEPFVRRYIDRFKFGVVDARAFRGLFDEQFPGAVSELEWDAWVYKPGFPPAAPPGATDTKLVDLAEHAADEWVKSGSAAAPDAARGAPASWTCDQVLVFLDRVLELQAIEPLPEPVLRGIDATFRLSASANAEIKFKFFVVWLRARREDVFDDVVRFLGSVGRMKYVRPLYRELAACSDRGDKLARETFTRFKLVYHSIAAKMVARDLGVEGPR